MDKEIESIICRYVELSHNVNNELMVLKKRILELELELKGLKNGYYMHVNYKYAHNP